MKPHGLFFAILDTPRGPAGVDADYDWHVQRLEADRRAARPASRPRRASIAQRLVALARRAFDRTAEPFARRA